MSFRFDAELKRDSAHVKSTLTSEAFWQQVATRYGGAVESFSLAGSEVEPRVNITLAVPAKNFPSQVQRFVADPLPISVVADFSGDGATAQVRPLKIPAEANLQIRLVDGDEGSVVSGSGSVTSNIPLFGSRIASRAEEGMPKMLGRAFSAVDKWEHTAS